MRRKEWILPAVLLLCGVLLIGLGIFRGEPLTVLEKATKICLECIGIG